jgi:putative DNA primase/helicase
MPADYLMFRRLKHAVAPSGSPYSYSSTQRVNRAPLPNGGKRFYCEHLADGRWLDGAGPDPWPLFNHGAHDSDPGDWILEVEGEKCAELVTSAAWAGISQPGHAHGVEQIRQRYEALAQDRIGGVVYLADHDATGRQRAQQAVEAAALAGMPLIVLHAGDLWPDLPEGGSIDDAPSGIEYALNHLWAFAIQAHTEALAAAAERSSAEDEDDGEHLGDEAPAAEAQPEPEPYQVLGWCADRRKVWYRHRQTAQIASAVPYGQAELLKLAPLAHWWNTYPITNDDDEVIRCNWAQAADDIARAADDAGVFEVDQLRGRGVWIDDGRTVWHLGNRLEVDGVETPLTDLPSTHQYGLMPVLPIDPTVAPLDDDHGRQILQVLKDCGWQGPSDHLHLAGYTVLSNVGGALRKRPGLQVSSPFGSGKSDTIENGILPLQGGVGRLSSGSTEAGIRQLIGRDALPCTIDESEAEDGRKREAQLRLVRFSFDGIRQVKGTPSGEAMTFCLRSSLALAGINAPIDNPADRSRMAVIGRRMMPADQWKEVSRRRSALITNEIGQRLIRRTVSNLPALLANVATFAHVIGGQIASNEGGRAGDTYGALLAGAHHLTSTKQLTEDEAQTWLDSVGWEIGHADTDDTDRKAGAEGRQCLEYLLAHELRWIDPGDRESGRPSTGSLTVRELVNLAHNSPRSADGQEARTALGRKGIHATDDGLAVARSAPGTMGMFSTTKWMKGGHAARLLEIEGTTRASAAIRFPSGGVHRAVIVPWAAVGALGEE